MARRVEVHLVGDSASLERAYARAGRSGEQFQRSFSTNLKSFAKAGAIGAAVGGVALLTKGLVSSVDAAREAEVAEAQLRQALKASGKSYKVYGKQIDAAIQKTSKLAAIDDEELSASFSKLLRTTGSVTKATKAMALAADIARARNISLDSATKVVERTLNGQYLSLRRVGVQVDSNMTSTQALEAAQRKFAGSAEAYGKTSAGAQEKFSVALENLQEKIGKHLLPVLTKLSLWGVRFITWAEENWPKFQKKVGEMWAKVKPIFEGFKTYFEGWVNLIKGIIDGDWSRAWKGLKQIVSGAFEAVFEYFKGIPARLVRWGLRMGKNFADAVIRGIGDLSGRIARALIPGDAGRRDPVQGPGSSGGRTGGRTTGSDAQASGGGRVGRRARGGPVAPGQSYIVGERGPELLTMGGSGGHITPNAGGGVYINNLNLPGVSNAREFLAELQRLASMGAAQQRGRHGGQRLALN